MISNLAVFVGIPLALMQIDKASASAVGLAMLPGSLALVLLAPLAGRIVDRVGPLWPITLGIAVMLVATILLSVYGGVPSLIAAVLDTLLVAGFAFVTSPLATKVSLAVDPERLGSALSLNSMFYFMGSSFGSALLTIVLTVREGVGRAINPLHTGAAPIYSDAFLISSLPLVIALLFSLALRAYPNNPAARKAIRAQAKWRKAR